MNRQKQKTLLCMDLEGTLLSNAVSQIPRPGLRTFLESVSEGCDLMLYTSVSSERVHEIRNLLIEEGIVPVWFLDLPILHPTGTIKDKARCGRSDALLLDDQAAVVAPGEESWWAPIAEYLPPYSDQDRELVKALATIKSRLGESYFRCRQANGAHALSMFCSAQLSRSTFRDPYLVIRLTPPETIYLTVNTPVSMQFGHRRLK